MKILTIIPPELEQVLKSIKHKKKLYSLIAIYNGFLFKHNKSNKEGRNEYFDVPSNYLEKIRSKPAEYRDILVKNNIIEYYTKNEKRYYEDPSDIFSDEIVKRKKYYNTNTGQCMKYRFLINTSIGKEIEIDIKTEYDERSFYKITKKSLEYLSLEPRIILDSFSRRLHTNITNNIGIKISDDDNINSYKELFKLYNEKYCSIDAIQCQPRLLYNFLKENNIDIDIEFEEVILKNNFYEYLKDELNLIERDLSKKEFVKWLNGEVFHSSEKIKSLFPKVNNFITGYKQNNGYKSLSKKLQIIESNIFIHDILNNIENDLNIDFCLSVHDSLIIKYNDLEKVYDYCYKKYGNKLDFKIDKLN
jgi:hypothetical protein